jgi:DNA-binding response OmpR family regulator
MSGSSMLSLQSAMHCGNYCALSYLTAQLPKARMDGMSDIPLILVIEDEYPLQGLIEDALSEGGFAFDIVSSAEEALSLFRGGAKKYKALVTDVNLKGRLNGWDIARQIRKKEPAFPVVYMTGAAADQWASQGVPNSILLEKPFAPAQVVTAISTLLNTGTPSV